MKRVHIEFMTATIILVWVISNILLMKPKNISSFFIVIFLILIGIVMQYIGLIVEAATAG